MNFGLGAVAAPLLLAQLAYTPGRDVDGPVSESVSAWCRRGRRTSNDHQHRNCCGGTGGFGDAIDRPRL